jgi:hypothetical protein
VDSSDSSSQWIDDLPIPSPYTYHIPDIHSQQPTRWVYEWIDTELYNMCYQDWQITAEWTNFTWQEHKTPSLNLRYYAHVDGGVLCNAACTTNVVVYLYVSCIICMYYV